MLVWVNSPHYFPIYKNRLKDAQLVTLELYHTLYSTCSQKVRLCLFEKGIPWVDHHVDLKKGEQLTDEYRAVNPHAVVPALKHDGRSIIESSVIVEYIDDIYPEPSLSPSDPYGKAQLRAWVCFINEVPVTYIRYPSSYAFVPFELGKLSEEERQENVEKRGWRKRFVYREAAAGMQDVKILTALEALRRTVEQIDEALAEGDWIMGSIFSLAEVNVIPTIDRMEDLGMEEIWEDKPRFIAWWQRIKHRESYRMTYCQGARVGDLLPEMRATTQSRLRELCARNGWQSMAGVHCEAAES
jgi:glutathione S-transferase